MRIGRVYTAEVMKLMEHEQSKDQQTQIVRMHQHRTNSTQFQTVKSFKISFRSERKQIKIPQNLKEKWKEGCVAIFTLFRCQLDG
jgi:hypothetical protein